MRAVFAVLVIVFAFSADAGGGVSPDVFLEHVRAGDYRKVAGLLKGGQDPDTKNYEGKTALMFAVEAGNVPMARLLLASSADVGVVSESGDTAFKFGVTRGHIKLLELLLEARDVIDRIDRNGKTPLMLAAEQGNLEVVEWLVKKKALVHPKDKNDWTAFRWATSMGHAKVADFLLQHGAQVNELDVFGNTPLIDAARKGHKEMVEFLMSKGADRSLVNKRGESAYVIAQGTEAEALLGIPIEQGVSEKKKDIHFARAKFAEMGMAYDEATFINYVTSGDLPVVDLFLKYGMNPNTETTIEMTVLMVAAEAGHPKIARRIIEAGAEVDRQNPRGMTALMYAAREGDLEVAKVLIEKKAKVDLKNNAGDTALTIALKASRPRTHPDAFAQFVVMKGSGADLNLSDASGQTPLMWAAKRGYERTVEALVSRHCQLSAADNEGNTALFHSLQGKKASIVAMLLESGIKVDHVNNRGYMAPLLAARDSDASVMEAFLRSVKVRLEDRGPDGNSLLAEAVIGGNLPVVQMLLKRGALVSARNRVGDPVLALAAMGGKLQILKAVLESGADINSSSPSGKTPLMWASARGHRSVVDELINRGAFVNARDHEGISALALAKTVGDAELVKLLLNHGATD